MDVNTLTYTDQLVIVECCLCHMTFAMPGFKQRQCKENGANFFCPNGHGQVYSETAVMRLEREKRQLAQQVEKERSDKAWYIGRLNTEQTSHKHTANQLRGTRAVVTRFKKKIINGRCPCCSHEFKDLRRHMKAQHPDWNPDKHAKAMAAKAEL